MSVVEAMGRVQQIESALGRLTGQASARGASPAATAAATSALPTTGLGATAPGAGDLFAQALASLGQTAPTTTSVPAGPVAGYGGAQLRNAAAIIDAGRAMGLSERDITIGVMTAMGESSLTVVDHGDAAGPDSRGLFQQRDNGAWGSYADRMDPTRSATNFFRALAGVADRDAMTPTAVAHAVQRNADPNHYARYWDDAVAVVASLTGATAGPGPATAGAGPLGDLSGALFAARAGAPGVPGVGPGVPGVTGLGLGVPGVGLGFSGPAPAAGSGAGQQAVDVAMKYLGTPYVWGGESLAEGGLDCSGLVQLVYSELGVDLPRVARAQMTEGLEVPSVAQARPGDLIVTRGGGHIGIYVGDNQMIHAPRPGEDVQIRELVAGEVTTIRRIV